MPVPRTREEKEAFRGPPGKIDLDVREKGIEALVDGTPCIPPSQPIETGRKGTGGVGCRIVQPGEPPLFVKRWAFRNPAGMLEVGDFENGKRQGTWKQYHANGYPAAEGEFVADQREGIWNEWDEMGRFFARRTYKNGRLDGITVLFGGPEPEVEIWVDGRPEGRKEENRPGGQLP